MVVRLFAYQWSTHELRASLGAVTEKRKSFGGTEVPLHFYSAEL